MGSIIGPQGADGLSAFEVAQENGFTGTVEEWLESVKGEKGDTGATGAAGAAGATGADGLSAFEVAQENGFTGTVEEWLESVKGEKGDTGATGAMGATGADGLSAFEVAQENGFTGTVEEWLESLKGETGTFDPGEKLFTVVGPNGDSADMNYGDDLVFLSDSLDISVRPGSAIVEIEKKSSDTEGYFIPFGTGFAAVALPTTNSSGASVNVVNMGFGECGPGFSLTAAGSGVFTIHTADAWYTFTMPKDAILKGINMNVTNGVTLPSGKATISPYVVIATALPTSRTFTFIDETLTRSTDGFLNGVSYTQYEKTVAGASGELNVPLAKGTQVSIVFGITTTSPGTMAQGNYMICSGGLWFQ